MTTPSDSKLLTIHLKHQRDKSLGETNAKWEVADFWKKFLPEGAAVVSWYVTMGIG